MLSYQVSRSIEINKNQVEIINYLKNFKSWPDWSPWIILEPNSDLTYSHEQGRVGAGFQWNGARVGTGAIVLESTQDHRLDMELHFFRPFKSQAKVTFLVTPLNEGCLVEWRMQSRVPWFLFFMRDMFKSMVEMDYERGLRMLKSQLETGKVLSELIEIGRRKQDEIYYIGLPGAGVTQEIGPIMQEHIGRLYGFVEQNNVRVTGELFSFYLSMDMKRGYFEFITCLPVEEGISVSGDVVTGAIPACDTFVVEHRGEYMFLGNAWSMAMSLTRYDGIKVKSKPLGIERYLNDPNDTDKADLRTEVILFRR